MTTILEALKGISNYPIPLRTLDWVAESRGLDLRSEATKEVKDGDDYILATAGLLQWLSENASSEVTQGGQHYSLSEEQRKRLGNRAEALRKFVKDRACGLKSVYGYKGSRL